MAKTTNIYGVFISSVILSMTSCINTLHDFNTDHNLESNRKPESEYFSFATTQNPILNLDYGTIAGNALIEVFDHNPIVSSEKEEEEGYTLDSEALYKVFLDKKGCTNQKITLPAGVKNVWLYSHNWGVPTIVEANYNNGVISYIAGSRATQTRGAVNTLSENIVAQDLQVQNYHTLVDWGLYGKVVDINGLYSEGDLTAEMISDIQHFYWGGANSKPSDIDNSKYCVGTDEANIYISPDAKDKDGKPIESAQFWMTLVNESVSQQAGIGYFFYYNDGGTLKNYKDGEKLKYGFKSVEKFIIVPNYSIAEYAMTGDPYYGDKFNWGGNKFSAANAPAKNNSRIQLLFKDKDGNFTPNFPVGYRIGFFITLSGFQPKGGTADKGRYNFGTSCYTIAEWNSGAKRYSCLRLSDGSLVYGFESTTNDHSADDVIFMISSDKNNCFGNSSSLTTIPGKNLPDAEQTTFSTYAFEDMWPSGGDYDLNDVMVEHTSKVTSNISNDKEYIKTIEDTFTFVQPSDAATYVDAFAVQYGDYKGEITLPEGAYEEEETGSVIICEYAMGNINKSFTVKRSFAEGTFLKKDMNIDLNPFIISKYVKGQNLRIEVHLPKHKATSMADQSLNNHEDDAYYVDKDGKYPFAISIPKKGFTPSTEKCRIDVEYPDYLKWVESMGKEATDWYDNYQKK